MYMQGLTDEELMRYADGNTDGQLEIARRVLAGDWGNEAHDAEIEALTERIHGLEAEIEDLKAAE